MTWGCWAGDISEAASSEGTQTPRWHSSGCGVMSPAEKDSEAPTVNIQKVLTFKNLVTSKFFKYLLLQLVSNLLEMLQVHPLQTLPRFWFWAPLSFLPPANWMQILSNAVFFPPEFSCCTYGQSLLCFPVTEIKFNVFEIPSKYKNKKTA